jgi:hypothetical protein
MVIAYEVIALQHEGEILPDLRDETGFPIQRGRLDE